MDLKAQFQGFFQTNDLFTEKLLASYPVFEFPQIQMNAEVIKDLENIPQKGTSILGKRMEAFFKIAIKHSERYELVDHSIQVIQDKQTLGELDFLVYDRYRQKNLHVELVYKLYLYDDSFEKEIDRWIGPKRKDSLHRKLKRLQQKQFPLLANPATIPYLEKYGLISEGIEQQICFKAQLFDQMYSEDYPLINQNCLRGRWISKDQFTSADYGKFQFYSPEKIEWSASPENNESWVSYAEIKNEIEDLFELGQVPLIWMSNGDSFRSFFIVNW